MSNTELSRLRQELESLRQEVRSLRAAIAGDGAPVDLVCRSLKVVTAEGRPVVQAGTYQDSGWIEVDAPRTGAARLLLSGADTATMVRMVAPNGKSLITMGGLGNASVPWSGRLELGHAATAAQVRLWVDDGGGAIQAINHHQQIVAAVQGNGHSDAPAPVDGSGTVYVSDGLGKLRVALSGRGDRPDVTVQGPPGNSTAALKPTGVVTYPAGAMVAEGPGFTTNLEPPSLSSAVQAQVP